MGVAVAASSSSPSTSMSFAWSPFPRQSSCKAVSIGDIARSGLRRGKILPRWCARCEVRLVNNRWHLPSFSKMGSNTAESVRLLSEMTSLLRSARASGLFFHSRL